MFNHRRRSYRGGEADGYPRFREVDGYTTQVTQLFRAVCQHGTQRSHFGTYSKDPASNGSMPVDLKRGTRCFLFKPTWVWVKITSRGDRRFESLFPSVRLGYPVLTHTQIKAGTEFRRAFRDLAARKLAVALRSGNPSAVVTVEARAPGPDRRSQRMLTPINKPLFNNMVGCITFGGEHTQSAGNNISGVNITSACWKVILLVRSAGNEKRNDSVQKHFLWCPLREFPS